MSSAISDFYAERSVLVTGFTGFLGKVVVEKLIRSCPDIKAIYALVRPLKEKDANQRVAKILESALYDQVRRDFPKALTKIIPISGDIMEDNLALSNEDIQTLSNNVTVVFHCAATVKFDEDLRFAMQMNVVGVQRLLKLCHGMKNFAAFVHTSTAYSNCNLKRTAEKIYPAPMKPQKLIASLEWMNDDMVRSLSHHLLNIYNRPNTYAFTKALAEQLMLDECTRLPITIVRPSIIAGTWQEPSPGWIDNLNGTAGLMTAQYKGLIRCMPLGEKAVSDIVPVDTVSNTMIAAGWQRGNMTGNQMPIIHCTTGQLNPITWGQYREHCQSSMEQYPLLNPIRYPGLKTTLSPWWFSVNHLFFHLIPAYSLDIMTKLTGGKPILVRVVSRLQYALDTLRYFITQEWYFASKNLINLHQSMSDVDKKKFNIDIREMNWKSYVENYTLGIRKLILKDELSTLPMARRKAYRYNILNKTLTIAFAGFVLRLLIRKNALVGKIWQNLLNLLVRVYHLIQNTKRAITL